MQAAQMNADEKVAFLNAVAESHGQGIADECKKNMEDNPEIVIGVALARAVASRRGPDIEKLGDVRFDSRFTSQYRDDWKGPKRKS